LLRTTNIEMNTIVVFYVFKGNQVTRSCISARTERHGNGFLPPPAVTVGDEARNANVSIPPPVIVGPRVGCFVPCRFTFASK